MWEKLEIFFFFMEYVFYWGREKLMVYIRIEMNVKLNYDKWYEEEVYGLLRVLK